MDHASAIVYFAKIQRLTIQLWQVADNRKKSKEGKTIHGPLMMILDNKRAMDSSTALL